MTVPETTTTGGGRIHRTTMFKIPDSESQKKLIEAYRVLRKDQEKNGKPYILRVSAGLAIDDPRSKGYTVVASTEFASLDDMKYYDAECAAHAALKKKASTLGVAEPPLAIFFESQI
ncbi:hypothetical protein B0H66DRAFT_66029 [Apodospora peruviana]|uniref:Stress-response A/B barrel domain-containing protein n=1 Tax=Apodospora peruviana TaxID=516989 RepID=A0AAE0ISK5_9PEZI|nr:hypothetical protein B0H66DRAFT_66029 [Apodospora peruviana]